MKTLKKSLTTILFLVAVCVGLKSDAKSLNSTPTSEGSSIGLYKSLVSSIDQAKGRVILFLNDGYWKTKIGSNAMIWKVKPLTKMIVSFQYSNGQLSYAKVVFKSPVHVSLKNPMCVDLEIDSLTYANDGSVEDNPGIRAITNCSSRALVNIIRSLNFSTSPKDLFGGKPFPSLNTWQYCNDENGNDCENVAFQNLFYEIKFYPDINESSALNIRLKSDSKIEFSSIRTDNPNIFGNYIVTNPGTSFDFLNLDYKFETKELSGYINNFSINVQRGVFASSDCMFDMSMGSSVILKNVSFSNSNGNSLIDASSGIINSNFNNGSFININSSPLSNHLLLNDNTTASILGFKLIINDKNYTSLEIGNGSKFSLKISQGSLTLGTRGFVNIVSSEIDADIQAVFQSGQPPSVLGRISKLSVNTNGGEFYPNEVSKLIVGNGTLHSNELYINSTAAPYVTGSFDVFNVNIGENSVFSVPNNGLKLITDVGGKINSNDAAQPIKFVTGFNYPIGSFDLSLPYKSFVNSSFKKIAFFDGNFKGKFVFSSDNSIFGTDVTVLGKVLLDFQTDNGSNTVPVDFGIDKATLTYNSGRPQDFSGQASIKIGPSANPLKITTPPSGRIPDHDDARVYPLTLLFSLKDPITISQIPFSFSGTSISLNFSSPAVIRIGIPTGCGEYQGDDYVPQNCTHDGPDWAKNLQELARDKFLTSTIHVYLFNDNYDLNAKISVSYDNTNSALVVNLTDLKNSRNIGFNTDGGGIYTAIGDALAFLFNGVCDILPYISCHVDNPNDAINKAIAAQIAKKITQFNQTWKIRLNK